jgi:hypothetical protein
MIPLLATLLAGVPAIAGPVLVEEVVAELRNPPDAPPRAILLSRLTVEARIAMVARGAVEAAFRPIDREALRATLDWLLDQTLLADDAARLQLAEVTREQAAAELGRFQQRFPDRAAYARFLSDAELSDEEVAAVLARMLRVDRYLESRAGRGSFVADADVDDYVREHRLTADTRASREAVRSRMGEERVEAAVKDLLAELRARAEVRILDPELARPAGPRRGEGRR